MFKVPSTKSVTSAAVQIGSGVAGAKLSDGVVAIIPEESVGKFRRPLVVAFAFLAAASVNATTTGSQAMQAFFAGMAIKQAADAVSEALVPVITPKDSSKLGNKFINAIVGHDNVSLSVDASKRFALNAPWDAPEPTYELQPAAQFAGI